MFNKYNSMPYKFNLRPIPTELASIIHHFSHPATYSSLGGDLYLPKICQPASYSSLLFGKVRPIPPGQSAQISQFLVFKSPTRAIPPYARDLYLPKIWPTRDLFLPFFRAMMLANLLLQCPPVYWMQLPPLKI
jgi:hypothetical protein